MAGNYVFSTLPVDMIYTGYKQREGDLPILVHQVLIKGGAGVANDRIITPNGIRTEITDEDKEVMLQDETCKIHVKNGYIKFETKAHDADKVSADMARRDKSSPLVPEDYDMESDDAVKPVLDAQTLRELKKKNK